MEEIVTILSTREWAITIWGTGFFIWMLMKRIALDGLELDVGVVRIMGDGLNSWQKFICMTSIYIGMSC